MSGITSGTELQQRLRTKLTEYDMYVLVDKTGSMDEPVKAGSSKSRWTYMQETLRDFTKFACEIDDDGIVIGFFSGNQFPLHKNVTADQVDTILNQYKPGGGTVLAPALNQMFREAQGSKKDLIIVFLDGEVNDPRETEAELIAQANRQNSDNDCTVLFVQVGDDTDAKRWLQTLDDNLTSKGAKFDIVDVKTVDEVSKFSSFEELLATAITD